jgi:multidrug efflux pump subunit AcrB
LEDALSAIPDILNVQSSSENSLSRVFIRFKPGRKGRYEAVRDAAQRVYENLPSSAQRPEIISSTNSMIPVWSAAVFSIFPEDEALGDVKDNVLAGQMLEKIVKPRLESLENAGEVLVYGNGTKEITITLDQEKLFSLNLNPSEVAGILAMNDSLFSSGTIVQHNREMIITVDGRYNLPYITGTPETSSLEKALIPLGDGKAIELSEIAIITEQERMPDILSRLNGRKAVVISIMGRNGADLRKLSAEIKKEVAVLPLEFIVLSDLGAEEAAAFRSVFNAALLGAIMVAITGFLLKGKNTSNRSGIFCAVAIPLICLVSAAGLLICGYSIDRLALAGIAAGVGVAVDSVILCSEKLRKCPDYSKASQALTELFGPLAAGAATTIAALLPLVAFEKGEAGIIAVSIIIVTITAFIMGFLFLPPIMLWGLNEKSFSGFFQTVKSFYKIPLFFKNVYRHITRQLSRFLALNIKFCLRYPILICVISISLTVLAILSIVIKGVDTSTYGSEDSVYAQVEFDGGLLTEEVDRLLALYSEKLADSKGIKNVETGARTGSGSLLISFDPKQIKANDVRDLAKQIHIPGGFIFFHENSKKDRYWEIHISGNEDKKCREFAVELAGICAGYPLIKDCVLNFKQGSKKMILIPDRELLVESGIGFSNAAGMLRFGIFGPVVYKKLDSKGEIDVRIKTGNGSNPSNNVTRQSREDALGLLVSSAGKTNSPLRIDSLMHSIEETEPSSIRRIDRRRTASITIITGPKDPRRIKKELDVLFKKLTLPPGYSIEFDPDAIRQAQTLSSTVTSLLMAVIFCYMIIASINESFLIPLIVLSAIPPSLAVPALCLILTGSAYNSSVACAFIAVSGMTVNSAVLCVDGLRSVEPGKSMEVYLALRRRLPVLLATTGTTVAGALPFLFLGEGANTLIRTLSLVGAIGVASSCFCAVTLIPSLSSIFKSFIRPKPSDF